jgi:hypothetical protein
MRRRRLLKDLSIHEVSCVDRAANTDARVLLLKREHHQTEGHSMSIMESIEKAASALRSAEGAAGRVMTPAQAFTKIFEALPLEKREEIKAAQRASVDGVPHVHREQPHDNEDGSDDEDNDTRGRKKPKALRKLLKVAKRIRAESPSLTEAQSIAKAVEERPDLYRRDRAERGLIV